MKRFKRFAVPATAAAAASVLVFTGGCSNANKSAQSKASAKHWDAARASVVLTLAKDQFKAGAFDKCRNSVDQAKKLMPESAQVYILSGKLYIEENQLEQAERELKLARKYAPNDGEAHYLSGVIYQRWQKPDVAMEFYKTASAKSPAELAYVLAQGEMLVAMNRPQEALELLEPKVVYFEHSGVIRDAVAQIYQQLGRNAEAVGMFRQAAILSEDDDAVRERFALALFRNNEHREAAEQVQKLVAKPAYAKRADLFTMLGECQLQLGKARPAKMSYETASELDPDSPTAWRGLGRALLELEDYRRAETSLTKALQLDPSQSEANLLMGYAHLRQNQLPDALASFQAASRLAPTDTVSVCMVGYVHEKLGEGEEAFKWYEKALQMKPGDELATKLMAGADLND
jgi:Tfp pilus assembly protein PilF